MGGERGGRKRSVGGRKASVGSWLTGTIVSEIIGKRKKYVLAGSELIIWDLVGKKTWVYINVLAGRRERELIIVDLVANTLGKNKCFIKERELICGFCCKNFGKNKCLSTERERVYYCGFSWKKRW